MAASPGAWVTSNIELVTPIAEGAMGRVWVAYHHRLGTRVAVKFVSEKLGDGTAEALARLEREAFTASQIKSPHVVQTFDSGITSDGEPYIVMELLDGVSLGDRLRQSGPLAWGEALAVITQVARALSKAHKLGIVHRDIKPDNIFLCRSDDGIMCKVLDFGIAKQTRLPAMGGLTTEGKIVGTPEFMSPEQVLDDRAVDYRADLWALAVVMYATLTGQLPFRGKTLGQLCLALVNRRPKPPSDLREGLPPETDPWFEQALNREPKKRFTSAREMAESFASIDPTTGSMAAFKGAFPTLVGVGVSDVLEPDLGATTSHWSPKLPGRWGTPLLAALVAVGLLLLGAAGFVLARPTATLSVPAVEPILGAAVQSLPEPAAPPEPTVVLDLDEEGDYPPARSTKSPRRPNRGKASSKPRPAASATKPPAAAQPDRSHRRGKDELGF